MNEEDKRCPKCGLKLVAVALDVRTGTPGDRDAFATCANRHTWQLPRLPVGDDGERDG